MKYLSFLVLLMIAALLTNFLETFRQDAGVDSFQVSNQDLDLPDSDLFLLDQKTIFNKDTLPQKPVLLTFFGTWCRPCLVEHDTLVALSKRGDIPFIGIALRDNPTKIEQLIKAKGNPFAQIALDPKMRWGETVDSAYLPTTYLTNGKGKIVYKVQGVLTQELYEKNLLPKIIEVQNAF